MARRKHPERTARPVETPIPSDETGEPAPESNEIPRPLKLPKDVERNLVEGKACPECGLALTKQRQQGNNYHACTGNYGENPTCSWFRQIDADGNYVQGRDDSDDW